MLQPPIELFGGNLLALLAGQFHWRVIEGVDHLEYLLAVVVPVVVPLDVDLDLILGSLASVDCHVHIHLTSPVVDR